MKRSFLLAAIISFLFAFTGKAQHNPYLDKKKKDRPSSVMARENKKDIRKQKKAAKKQMRRSKKHINRKRR